MYMYTAMYMFTAMYMYTDLLSSLMFTHILSSAIPFDTIDTITPKGVGFFGALDYMQGIYIVYITHSCYTMLSILAMPKVEYSHTWPRDAQS